MQSAEKAQPLRAACWLTNLCQAAQRPRHGAMLPLDADGGRRHPLARGHFLWTARGPRRWKLQLLRCAEDPGWLQRREEFHFSIFRVCVRAQVSSMRSRPFAS
ncbi:unnamed protein product [Symbiodinium natans]|uniref:Uncharacterized protein n=1 Tax=Symbiodinium natans TaxID=878477 RepID=A0A812UYS5_9DINO|nr:unnamed protein product [Symbiodinium natans]